MKKLKFAVVAMLLSMLCINVNGQSRAITAEIGAEYALRTIMNVVMSYSQKPGEILALKNRMGTFKSIVTKIGGNIDAYTTTNDQLRHVLMGWSQPTQGNGVGFFVVVPTVIGLQSSKSKVEFEDYIAVAIAHEVIHWELSKAKKFPLNQINRITRQQESHAEAVAWGITILEIIRPMIMQGRMNDQDVRARSSELATFKDDYNHPSWIKSFSNYPK